MNKAILILVCLVALIAYAEATGPPRCRRVCRKNVASPITCARDGKICRRIRRCALRELNCRRRALNQRRIRRTRSALCRNIKGPLGIGPCARRRKPRDARPDCNRIRCSIPSRKLGCYRSRRNNCRLLTSCQLARANCRRGRRNALRRVNSRACAGLKRGGRYQKCRPIPKRG